MRKVKILSQLSRFGITGFFATATHLGVIFTLQLSTDFSATTNHFYGYLSAFVFSFFCHRKFTFKSKRPYKVSFVLFVLVSLFSFIVSLGVLHLADFAGANQAGSLLVAAASMAALTFFMGRRVFL